MNVLSLFDGMSCGMIALERAGIKVTNYFASEIDKYAQIISEKNYPEIIRLGDVTKVRGKDLPKIDLIIGGSPCQGFSMAGKMLGHDDPRSKLFWEFKRLVDECSPQYFMLENVRMKKSDEQIITEAMGVKPVMINSALLSAQNRKRLYWTNINAEICDLFGTLKSHIPQPDDKNLFLKDIIEPEVDAKYYLTEKQISAILEHKKRNKQNGNGFGFKPKQLNDKANPLLNACFGSRRNSADNYLYCDYRTDEGLRVRSNGKSGTFKSNALKAQIQNNNYIVHSLQPRNGQGQGGKGHLQKTDGKSYALDTNNGQAIQLTPYSKIRRLTPIECERLQTVPDNYTAGVSDSQRYKMLGNGWTVDVIAHILKHIET